MSAVEHLIRNSVDYAGLFPPAGLSLSEVVENFAQYRLNNVQEMLARLIVPASRLQEFDETANSLSAYVDPPWKISALVPPVETTPDGLSTDNLSAALQLIRDFNQRDPAASSLVDAIEVKSTSIETTRATAELIPDSIQAFLEFDWRDDPTEQLRCLSLLGRGNLFAKIRTGGVTEDLIPAPENVARFLLACAANGVGLKATAGLHHPLRGDYRLTYLPDANVGKMHGFINVFVAACFAFAHKTTSISELSEVLGSESASEFQISESAIGFGDLTVSGAEVQTIRSKWMMSFGSCSFTEPSDEFGQLFQFPQ